MSIAPERIKLSGWQPGFFGDHNLTAALLDRVVPDRPGVVYDSSFHNACLNSRALELAGIGADTPDPPNGHILRDGQGRATGMLHEEAIQWAVGRLPQLTDDHWYQGLLAGQAHANAHGITGVLDPCVKEQEARIYARGLAEDALKTFVRRLGYTGNAGTAAEAFLEDHRRHTQAAHSIHERIFFDTDLTRPAWGLPARPSV